MTETARIIPINIEDEMRDSYLDYAMSVIIGRAIPDIRDGLKPVHRRILYAMYREGLLAGKKYSKCAGVVGEVLKKYHPHGDLAVYDALVRMAQDWNMRHVLIDGQGNFGSMDGDSPAAYRYTEARLAKLAEEMLDDIDKETVNFTPNFDESTTEPSVLPSKIPNLLVNGSEGIAVGMATKIPPHNLGEICEAAIELTKNPALTLSDLTKIVKGPDFPTGGIIYGREGIKEAYATGKGIIQIRGEATVEKAKGERENIVITEVPYQVNKAKLVETIARLVREGKVDGISDLRDESDRQGVRVVLELKKGAVSGVILNQLYKHTPLQSTFGVIMLSIVSGRPRVLNLLDQLQLFVGFRREIILRRTTYELKKAEERAHILEGLKIATQNIDEVVALIKKSPDTDTARKGLMKRFELSYAQAQAILDLRLHRLTSLERQKIIEEYDELQKAIRRYKAILKEEKLVNEIIVDELTQIKTNYADPRRTKIVGKTQELTEEDLITEEDMVVTVSHSGYIKRNPVTVYRSQRRGGRGKMGMTTREEDFVSTLFVASTLSYILVFTTIGRVYWLKVHEVPLAGRTAKGKPVVTLVNMRGDEGVAAVLPVRAFAENRHVVFATKNGIVKRTPLSEYSNPRPSGIIALKIEEGDGLVAVRVTDGTEDIFLATRTGLTIRFKEDEARDVGRAAVGVIGIRLDKGDSVVAMEVLRTGEAILTVSDYGYGKRTPTEEYRAQGRGGRGIKTIKVTEKNGLVVGVQQVADTDEVMLITDRGRIIRTQVAQISTMGRATQGVHLMKCDAGEKVSAMAKLAEQDGEGDVDAAKDGA